MINMGALLRKKKPPTLKKVILGLEGKKGKDTIFSKSSSLDTVKK
jgi:hypothetical protein